MNGKRIKTGLFSSSRDTPRFGKQFDPSSSSKETREAVEALQPGSRLLRPLQKSRSSGFSFRLKWKEIRGLRMNIVPLKTIGFTGSRRLENMEDWKIQEKIAAIDLQTTGACWNISIGLPRPLEPILVTGFWSHRQPLEAMHPLIEKTLKQSAPSNVFCKWFFKSLGTNQLMYSDKSFAHEQTCLCASMPAVQQATATCYGYGVPGRTLCHCWEVEGSGELFFDEDIPRVLEHGLMFSTGSRLKLRNDVDQHQ